MSQPQVVTYIYTLRSANGRVLAKSGEKKETYIETLGQVLGPLERALQGCEPGTRKSVKISAREGFGDYNDSLVVEVPLAKFKKPPRMDQEVVAKTPSGQTTKMKVVDMKDDAVVLDGNHPFAGQDVVYDVEILDIRPAHSRELESGQPMLT